MQKYQYQYIKTIQVTDWKMIYNDMFDKVRTYIIQRESMPKQWKTASQIASEIGFLDICQRETRAVTSALREIGIAEKISSGLKFYV